MRRNKLANAIAEKAGSDVLKIEDAATGWPATATVTTPIGPVRVALHVGPIGLSHRGRDAVERRFQNPGSDRPITASAGQIPMLLGIWEEEHNAVFVCMDARQRLDKPTRVSLFVPLALLRSASVSGWEEHYSQSGEHIFAFLPGLLPVYAQLLKQDVSIDPSTVAMIAAAAGITDASLTPIERGRRTISTLARNASFSRTVKEAYGGKCAMCGLNFSLVVGAHIYPVAAAGSVDELANGLALCHNHHAAFDSHKIFVDPESRHIQLHSDLIQGVHKSEACRQFVSGTFAHLTRPMQIEHSPRKDMFEKRYEYFAGLYDWV